MRVVFALLVSFAVTAALGRAVIPWLRAMKAGQSIKEIGPVWHKDKEGTPTMGGIMFMAGIAAAVVTAGFPDLSAGRLGGVFVLLLALIYGLIGFFDDYMKVKHHQNEGLTAAQKFLLQLAAALVVLLLLRNSGYLAPEVYLPFVNRTLPMPFWAYLVFASFVIVGTVNAVNITDGVDGLASSVTVPVALIMMLIALLWGRTELAVLSAALCGGLFGFLLYNHYPAKVFMGDTGSLFLGGAVAGLAFALDIPLALIFMGVIYIAETMSDIIQVTYFKATHGKRIFRMAPLHHHFEMGGWKETKVVRVFSLISLLGCVLGLLGVIGRFR